MFCTRAVMAGIQKREIFLPIPTPPNSLDFLYIPFFLIVFHTFFCSFALKGVNVFAHSF